MIKDEKLIEQVLKGDRAAFNVLIEKYYSICYATACKMLQDQELAKDLVQTAFMQAYFCISNLKDASLFKYWLLGIVKNEVKNFLKKTQKTYASLEGYHQYIRGEEENHDFQHIAEVVVENINALPEAYRKPIYLFYYENMRLKEIAEACSLSVETVKVRLYRGRNILKKAFQQYPEFYQYQQMINNKHMMKKINIADIMMGGANKEHCAILLQDEGNTTAFLIIITTTEAMDMVMALKNMEVPRPSVFSLTATMMHNNQLKLDSIYIHDLIEGIFVSTIKIEKGKKIQEFDARPSDAITFALLFDRPMFVSQQVLDKVGFPIPEKYKHKQSKENGIAALVEAIEDWKNNITLLRAKTTFKAKTEQQMQQAVEKLLAFAFHDEPIA